MQSAVIEGEADADPSALPVPVRLDEQLDAATATNAVTQPSVSARPRVAIAVRIWRRCAPVLCATLCPFELGE
jgi:hypothetical protein